MAESYDDFVAGWTSGAAAMLATQPLDMAITRLQSGSAAPVKVLVEETRSVTVLWRGITPLLLSAPINNALMFIGYGAGKRAAERDASNNPGSLLPVFVGGCVGGFAQSFIQSPLELLKVRWQLAEGSATPALMGELMRQQTDGNTGIGARIPPLLHRGLLATLARDVIPHGVWFSAYDWSKSSLQEPEGNTVNVGVQVAAGAFAATAAWLVGYPADVLKTRCQMQGAPSSILDAARQLHAEAGIAGFYKGLTLKLLRAVPMSVIGFFVYEVVYRKLGRLRVQGGAQEVGS